MVFHNATIQLSRRYGRRAQTNAIIIGQFNIGRVPDSDRGRDKQIESDAQDTTDVPGCQWTKTFGLQIDGALDDLRRETMDAFERECF